MVLKISKSVIHSEMPCTYEQFVSRVGSAWIDTDEKWAENTCNETLSRDKLFNLNINI